MIRTMSKGILYNFIFTKKIDNVLYINTGPSKQQPSLEIVIVILQWNQDEANGPEIQK